MRILVTGAAGFIGNALCRRIQETTDWELTGVDSFHHFPHPICEDRLALLDTKKMNYSNCDIEQFIFPDKPYDVVIHLAAKAGVQQSIQSPHSYGQTNLMGFLKILEQCRKHKTPLIYASSSSVYGPTQEHTEHQSTDKPLSLYAATKKANEVMAHSYTHLFGFPTLGLRFFTVYGPWGRPDMVMLKWLDALRKGKDIQVNNNGHHERDFTYIDDVVTVIMRLVGKRIEGAEVLNVGTGKSVSLLSVYNLLSGRTGSQWPEGKISYQPLQKGDVLATQADTTKLKEMTQFVPSTTIEQGIPKLIWWYNQYLANSKI